MEAGEINGTGDSTDDDMEVSRCGAYNMGYSTDESEGEDVEVEVQ